MTRIHPGNVDAFRSLVARRLGLSFDESKRDFLEDIFTRRMEAGGWRDPEAYMGMLAGAPGRGAKEMALLAEALTVNETFFFRNINHFRALVEEVLPERLLLRASQRRLRLLSAGCSSGEEAYTLAMLLCEHFPELSAWDVGICAVDVSPAVLAIASEGLYSPWSLRSTEPWARDKYFRPEAGKFRLAESIRSMVSFEERNLAESNADLWNARGPFDIVFCRNVLMYFVPETASGIVARISHALAPGGYLFLGHAETLRGLSQDFHLRHTHGTFYYQRMGEDDRQAAKRGKAPGGFASGDLAPRDPGGAFPGAAATSPAEGDAAAWSGAGAWVEIIQRASDKIAGLAERNAAPPQPAEPAAAAGAPRPQGWNRALALDLMRGERFGEALEVLRKLPTESSSDPDALLLHAVLLTNMGQRAEGEAVCRRLLAADGLNAGAHYLVALCREHAGDLPAAEEHDRTALYLDSSFAMPWLHLGLLVKRDGRAAEARRNLEQALALLAKEDSSRILLFGGGFGRDALAQLCRGELRALEGK